MRPRTTLRVAVVTASDRCAAGSTVDDSGAYLRRRTGRLGWVDAGYRVVPDVKATIARTLRGLCGPGRADVVLTTGGTGLAPRDVTPEATRRVIERDVPGLAELMRMRTAARTPFAALSRGVCGTRKGTLIVNLPGSLRAVKETFAVIVPLLPHAVEVLQGRRLPHGHRHPERDPAAAARRQRDRRNHAERTAPL